jgi:dipeptidyl aminopeptidase/acylaminoacyl peptidase
MPHPSIVARATITAAVVTTVVSWAATATNPSPGIESASAPPSAPSASLAAGADSDGLILFGVNQRVGNGTYCATFHTIRPDGSGHRALPVDCMPYGNNASWGPCLPAGGSCAPGDGILLDSRTLSSSATEIDEIVVDGDQSAILLTVPGFVPAFSPDGSQIAYSTDLGGIVIADADNLNPHHLTSTTDATDWQPRFSPDGSRVAFTRMTNDPAGGQLGVWTVNTDGTALHRLTAELLSSDDAHWSPDGSHLLFMGRQSVNGSMVEGLWTIAVDGTGLTPVINSTGGHNQDANWSPDGSRIVYTHSESGITYLRVMNADGSDVTTLLANSEGDEYQSLNWGLPSTLPTEGQ